MHHLTYKKLQALATVPEMDLKPIHAVLGEDTPAISPTPLGRMRLLNALKAKFGANYRNIPQASKALDHFASEMRYFDTLRNVKGVGRG